jgi:hypothetical protein
VFEFAGILRLIYCKYNVRYIVSPLGLERQKTAFSLSNFEILKFVETIVDTFSYKKLFYPTSYAKVMAVLPRHKVFL